MRPEEPLRIDISNWEVHENLSAGPQNELWSRRIERFLSLSGKGVQEFGTSISAGMQRSRQVSIEVRGHSSGPSHLMF